ncbi:TonB-dependent receptor [Gemmatimonas sp.]|jgi:iron complex outermembrane receptor protein|uniref:TonB-dependent receptor n=1 Tax=Gemmatimonas sp. TaxID=1962908 RepID=UPI0025BE0FA7|nr:TonB-dependent receptor [Gemmatimonas sp.]MCA2984948.1 TonB-dependent receptor [Gemmatimonas sp.]
MSAPFRFLVRSSVRPLARRCAALTGVTAATVMTMTVPLQAQDTHGALRHLHGVVEAGESGRPIRDADVVVSWRLRTGDRVAEKAARQRTDGNGRFDLRDLPPQVVSLRVRALGYAPFVRDVDLRDADRLLTVHLDVATTVLQEVAVRADTAPERLSRVAATSTLDAQALAATRGQTLGETIKNLPGVTVIQFGPSIAKPVIRGLNSQRVLVMNGGLRQEDQQWGTEHAPNIDSFEADAVTVVRGAATVLYGPDALGGVVRVDHAALPDTGGLRGTVALNAFSNSRQGAVSVGVQGADLSLPRIGTTGYRVRLTSRLAGNGGAPDYYLTNTGFRELNGSVALGVARDWGRAEVSLTRFSTELGVLRQAHVGNASDLARAMSGAPPDSAFSYTIGRPNQRVAHTTFRVRTVRTFAQAGDLEVVYGLQYNHRREYDNHGPLRFRNEPAFNLKLFSNALDVRWTHPRWKGWRGTVGTSAIAQGNQTLGKAFLIPGYDLWQGAVYAQEELAIGRLSINTGLRGDAIAQTTIAFADAGIRSPAGTKSWRNLAGSLGAAYLVRDGLDVGVRLARAWRPPTVNERYAQGVHHGTAQYELGDAELSSEQSVGVEGTLRFRRRTVQVDAAAYSNRVNGFIYLQPTQPIQTIRGAFPGFRYAQADARLRGVELATSYTPHTRVQITANGTVVRGTNRRTDEPLFDMPADRLSLNTRLLGARGGGQDPSSWHLGMGTLLVRQQDGVPNGTVYTLPTAGYALLQLEAGIQRWTLLGRRADMSLSVNNALDTRYRDYLSRYRLFVNDAGRDVVLRLTMPF